jgi:hypothetical protein
MKPYLLYFAAVYCILLVILVIFLFLGFKLSIFSLLPALFASACISSGHFIQKNERLPTPEEKIQLIWGSSAVAIVIASLFIFFIILMNPNAEQILKQADNAGIGLYAVVMLCLVAVHGAIFHFAYNWYARFCQRKVERNKQQ